jgi:hypothetical protein
VRGRVFFSRVGLDLGDLNRDQAVGRLVLEDAAEQFWPDLLGRAVEELPRD